MKWSFKRRGQTSKHTQMHLHHFAPNDALECELALEEEVEVALVDVPGLKCIQEEVLFGIFGTQ